MQNLPTAAAAHSKYSKKHAKTSPTRSQENRARFLCLKINTPDAIKLFFLKQLQKGKHSRAISI